MEILTSGKFKGYSKFFYDIGFDLVDNFNCNLTCSDEKLIGECVLKTMKEFDCSAEEVDVRKIRTTSRKIIYQKSGNEFIRKV